MKIEIKTSSYNARRYGKPYAAIVDLTNSKSTPKWAEWIGQAGDEGILLLDLCNGDVVMKGQKDGRGHNGIPVYGIFENNEMNWKKSKAEAYKCQKENSELSQPLANQLNDLFANFDTQQLIDEIARRYNAEIN